MLKIACKIENREPIDRGIWGHCPTCFDHFWLSLLTNVVTPLATVNKTRRNLLLPERRREIVNRHLRRLIASDSAKISAMSDPPEIEFSARAYCKMVLHAAKYPHCAVNGVLLTKVGLIT